MVKYTSTDHVYNDAVLVVRTCITIGPLKGHRKITNEPSLGAIYDCSILVLGVPNKKNDCYFSIKRIACPGKIELDNVDFETTTKLIF